MQKISTGIVDALLENGLIDMEDKDLYIYGVEVVLLKFLHLATMLIIGILLGFFFESALYILLYSILREYAGGYHAKSRFGCYLISWLMMFSVIIILKHSSIIPDVPVYLSVVFSTAVILILAPMSAENKPLDDVEDRHYKRITTLILFIELLIFLLFQLLDLHNYIIVTCLSMLSVSIMLLLRKFQVSIIRYFL